MRADVLACLRVKCPLFCQILTVSEFSQKISVQSQTQNFMKICPLEGELFHTNRQEAFHNAPS